MDSLVTLCFIFKCLAPSPNVSMPARSTVKSQLSRGQQNIVTLLLPEEEEEDLELDPDTPDTPPPLLSDLTDLLGLGPVTASASL